MSITSTDSNKLTINFLKAVRGTQSQEFLSLELGFDFNIYNRWENDRRGFYWDDLLLLVKYFKWDLSKALQHVTHHKFSELPKSKDVLKKILVPSAITILAKTFSKSKINRIKEGKSKLLFSEFLEICELLYGRRERFLRSLLPKKLSTFLDETQKTHADLTERASPLLSVIRAALDISAYKKLSEHSDEKMAQLLNLPIEDVSNALKKLTELRSIELQNKKYVPTQAHEDTGAQSPNTSRLLANSWRKEISNFVDSNAPSPQLLSAFLLYSTNDELEQKVFDLCRKFYMDLKNLVSSSGNSDKENVRYVCVDLYYPLGDKKIE